MAKTLMQRDPLRRDEPGLHGEQRDSRGSSAPRACAPASTPAAASRTDPSSSRFDRTRRAQSARTGWPLLGRNGVRIVGRRGPGSQFAESSRSPSAAHPIRGELGWWATSWLCARRVGRYSCARCSRISRDPIARLVLRGQSGVVKGACSGIVIASCAFVLATGLRLAQQAATV